jgi:two-component system nitrogen regulation response regulator NtrX
LNVVPFYVPPLRDRIEDVPLLAEHFLNEFTRSYGRRRKELTPEAFQVLRDYHWPGNVRELKNLMERIVIMNPQVRIDARHLPLVTPRKTAGERPSDQYASLHDYREAAERDFITRKLDEAGGNMTRAAELDSERSNLYRKMKSLGIAPKDLNAGA